jgi:hypothetical protein
MESAKDTKALLTCPHCKGSYEVEMPEDSCQIAFDCLKCGMRIVPDKGDCCVFCSYGDRKCPPEQNEGRDSNEEQPEKHRTKGGELEWR